jgi:flagellar export protein FliJ
VEKVVKKFRFALSGLEKLRQAGVDRAFAELARSERARLKEEEGIMRLNAAMVENTGVYPRNGRLDGAALAEESRYLGTLRTRRQVALTRLEDWITTVERDRRQLTHARKELKAVERLRERRYLEFVREVLREEGRDLDEAGGVRHQRRLHEEAA